VIPRGTCCVVADPHEIANVMGVEGVRFMIEDAMRTPLLVYTTIPSCVPSTALETSGARIGVEEIEALRGVERVIGLGEVMNYPGVLSKDPELMEKIRACGGMVVDGHAPGLTGAELCAYVSAGIGSDHESTSREEARWKLSLGMMVMMREGSASKNLSALAGLVSDRNARRFMLVTDDKSADDILAEGHMDHCLRRAVEEGVDPVEALRMATLNPAEYFGLRHLGGVAPGRAANMAAVDSLRGFSVTHVLIDGELVAEGGVYLGGIRGAPPSHIGRRTVNFGPLRPEDVAVGYAGGDEALVRVIGVVEGQIRTEALQARLRVHGGMVPPDVERDILKVCVVERHRGTGRIGRGFVKGFGLVEGALASSVAHDSHNVVAMGANDRDLCGAINRVRELNGGLVAYRGGAVAELPLPVAGLMSTEPAGDVAERASELNRAAASLGCGLASPFGTLSFLALPVIPELKITDHGLVDVTGFKVVGLFVERS
ncbi:MAG: adenine deaminase, partial [Candidatus Bathyarchaeia archaeon]